MVHIRGYRDHLKEYLRLVDFFLPKDLSIVFGCIKEVNKKNERLRDWFADED